MALTKIEREEQKSTALFGGLVYSGISLFSSMLNDGLNHATKLDRVHSNLGVLETGNAALSSGLLIAAAISFGVVGVVLLLMALVLYNRDDSEENQQAASPN